MKERNGQILYSLKKWVHSWIEESNPGLLIELMTE